MTMKPMCFNFKYNICIHSGELWLKWQLSRTLKYTTVVTGNESMDLNKREIPNVILVQIILNVIFHILHPF